MISCPYCARLPQFLDRQLGEEECRAIELHVETCCPFCVEELERLTAADGADLPLPPVPLGDVTPPDPAPDSDEQLPAVPGYQVQRVLGRGGRGIVYLAYHARLQRWVALKMIRAGSGAGPRDLARFRIEAEALARLQHPSIIPIYEVGDYQGRPFFAMEYVERGSLKDRLGDGLPPPREAAGLVETLARAIHYAHQRGVLHRDLTPGNILLAAEGTRMNAGRTDFRRSESEGQERGALPCPDPRRSAPSASSAAPSFCPKVTDFGLAKFLDGAAEQTRVTQSDEVLGTPSYMAPEQAAGRIKEIGTLTDVYGLGAILYKLLTGHVPFEGASKLEIINKVHSEAPPPPRRWRPEVPADLEAICLKCLEKEPQRRYASAEQLAEELGHFLRGEPLPHTRRVGPAERLWRWCRRNRALAAAGGLAACLMMATSVVSVGWAVHASRLAENIRGAWSDSDRARLRAQDIQRAWNESESARAGRRAQVECERGEIGLGLLWMARSLETAPEGAEDHCRALRASLAGWRSRLFPMTSCRAGTGQILAFGPGGSIAWAVEPGGSVCRRVLTTGERVGRPLPPGPRVTAVAAGRKGGFVLTVAGRVARVWEVATARPGPTIRPPGQLDAVALSPDEQTVLTADRPWSGRMSETTIRRWDRRTGQQLAPTCQHEGLISALALSPDGRTLLAAEGGEGAIRAWDVATGKPLGPLAVPRRGYLALAYSPDGRALLTGSRDQTARLWDARNGQPLGPSLYHGGPVHAVAFSHDGRTLLTADARGTVRTWAVADGPSPASVLAHPRQVEALAVSPDGKTVATGFEGKARLWRPGRGAEPKELPHGSAITALLLSPDGRTLLTADWKGTARLWDTDTGQPKGNRLRHDRWVHALAFTPDSQLAVTGSSDGRARVWDAATGALRAAFRHEGGVVAVALDPKGTRLLTGSTDGTARVWDIATRRTLGEPLRHRGPVLAMTFSRNGDRVLTGSVDGTARLWDAATGQPLGPPMVHGGAVWVAAFSPDGRRILTGSWDGTAQLWDAATGQPRGQPLQHADQVRAAAFSPDGRWVVTGSQDRTARLWDAATSRPLGPRLPHAGGVSAVAFSPGNRTVFTGSEDGNARLWQIPPPLEGPVERVILWAQVLTGMELDADGGVRALDPKAWQQRRQRLEGLGGPPAP